MRRLVLDRAGDAAAIGLFVEWLAIVGLAGAGRRDGGGCGRACDCRALFCDWPP